jgi:hypothetical protein
MTAYLEVKDGKNPPSARKLTPDRSEFHGTWKGPDVRRDVTDEALAAVGDQGGITEGEGE